MNRALNYIQAAVWGSVGLLLALIVMSALIHYGGKLPGFVGSTITKAGSLTSPDGWN